MDATDIYTIVQRYFSNHDHKWQNKFIFKRDWECDFFCVSNSGYCIEVEVKVSKSDFLADFKKPKHELFKTILLGGTTNVTAPNKFWYAFPDGMVTENIVPRYAGIIAVIDRGGETSPHFKIVRHAPFIHKQKLDVEALLFDKYRWHRESLIRENESLKRALQRLTKLKEA